MSIVSRIKSEVDNRTNRGEIEAVRHDAPVHTAYRVYEGETEIIPGTRKTIQPGDIVETTIIPGDSDLADYIRQNGSRPEPTQHNLLERGSQGVMDAIAKRNSDSRPSPSTPNRRPRRRHRLGKTLAAAAITSMVVGGGGYEVATAMNGLNSPSDYFHDVGRLYHVANSIPIIDKVIPG